jgi:hypothetical protein
VADKEPCPNCGSLNYRTDPVCINCRADLLQGGRPPPREGPPAVALGTPWAAIGRPLHQAAAAGDLEAASELVLGGADVNEQDEVGATPLHAAAGHNRGDAAELLLRRGADPELADRMGRTPLDAAISLGAAEAAQVLRAHGATESADRQTGERRYHVTFGFSRRFGADGSVSISETDDTVTIDRPGFVLHHQPDLEGGEIPGCLDVLLTIGKAAVPLAFVAAFVYGLPASARASIWGMVSALGALAFAVALVGWGLAALLSVVTGAKAKRFNVVRRYVLLGPDIRGIVLDEGKGVIQIRAGLLKSFTFRIALGRPHTIEQLAADLQERFPGVYRTRWLLDTTLVAAVAGLCLLVGGLVMVLAQ